jgi:hypothetical protein
VHKGYGMNILAYRNVVISWATGQISVPFFTGGLHLNFKVTTLVIVACVRLFLVRRTSVKFYDDLLQLGSPVSPPPPER